MSGFRTSVIVSGILMTINGAWAACPTGSRDLGGNNCICIAGYYGNYGSASFNPNITTWARCIPCPDGGLSVEGTTDGYHCFKLNVPLYSHPGYCTLDRSFIHGGSVNSDGEIVGNWQYERTISDGFGGGTVSCAYCDCGHVFGGPDIGCVSVSAGKYKAGTGTTGPVMDCPSYNGVAGTTDGVGACSQNSCYINCPTSGSDSTGSYTLPGGRAYWQ